MKGLFIWAGCATILALMLVGCANRPSGSLTSGIQVQSISAEALKKQVEARIDKDTVIVDLRESFLYKEEHIPGAILIPFANFKEQYTQLDKNKRIILACHTGPMAEASGQFLLTKGFTQVYNLEGGMRAWDRMQ